MAIQHVRARCTTTGHVAAISEKALDSGAFPDWVRADGPVPERPKPRLQLPTPAGIESAEEEE